MMVGKAEYLPKGPNSRFVVTNLPASEVGERALYERRYCGSGRKVSVRRVLVSLASGFPLAAVFRQAYRNPRDHSFPRPRPDPAPI